MGLIQKAFSDIITFSRASNATRIGPTGRVEYAPHNLLTYSEDFSNAAWTKTRSSITANVIAAPNGAVTAEKLVEDTTASNSHLMSSSTVTVVSGIAHTFSAYVKAGERTKGYLLIYRSDAPFTFLGQTTFDLTAGTVTIQSGSGTIASAGNGWYRVTTTATTVSTGIVCRVVLLDGSGTEVYTGDGASGIYLWGAQLSVGSVPGDYTPTTSAAVYGPRFDFDPVTLAAKGLLIEEQRTNLLTYSEQFDNAAWAKSNGSVLSNAATAPDGTLSADKFVEDSTASVHSITNTIGSSQSAGSYSYSVYIKADGRTQALVQNTVTTTYGASFDLTALTVLGTTGGATGSIVDIGNGWRRCTITFTSVTSITFNFAVYPLVNNSGFYQGNGTSGILLWGAQLEAGSFATSYIPTVASTVTRSADVASVNTLSPWFNATEGTLYAEHQAIYPSQGNVVASINDNSANRSVELQHRGTTPSTLFSSFTVVSGSITAQSDAGTAASFNALRKWAGAYKVNDFAASQNGGAVGVDTSGAVPSGLTQMQLMAAYWSSAASTSGWLRRIAFYPRRLANAELQALTA